MSKGHQTESLTVAHTLEDEHRGVGERDGRYERGHEGRVVGHEALELVLVAGGVLREDGVGLEAACAYVIDERLFGLDGHRVDALVKATQLQVGHCHLVLVAQQAVH